MSDVPGEPPEPKALPYWVFALIVLGYLAIIQGVGTLVPASAA